MRVLAFDACLGAVSAAAGVLRADGTWESVASDGQRVTAGHAEALMPMLDRVMREAGQTFANLDRIVATRGPGGFTGVRVAVAAARGFVLATGAKAVGLSTLDALAVSSRDRLGVRADAQPLAIAVDARRGMLFFAQYAPGVRQAEPALLTAEEAAARIVGPAIVTGSGAPALRPYLSGDAEVDDFDLQPEARLFASLAVHITSCDVLKPIYLRPPDAKAQTSFVLPRAPA